MIPRKIHQLWVGTKPIPDRERTWCADMQRFNPGWEYHLHGNELLEHYRDDPYVKHMLAKGEKTAFVTDRLRVLLLRDFGGIYIDADAQPVQSFDVLPLWEKSHVQFVAAMRSPHRKDVALHRSVPIIDNTFLASAPNGRLINRIASLWTPAQVTGERSAVNGHRTGIAIFENAGYDTILLDHRYIYCEQKFPESIVLHDGHNLGSWVDRLI